MKTTPSPNYIDHSCAMDVHYLRTQSRWSPNLEKELIQLHMNETPPNIMTFGLPDNNEKSLRIIKELNSKNQ